MKHLSQAERYQISVLLPNYRQAPIAAMVGVSPSTISREWCRNADQAGCYRPDRAHSLAEQRRHDASSGGRVDEEWMKGLLRRVLRDKWSPEAAVGRLCDETGIRVSVQTVYHRLRRDGYDARHKVVVKRYRRRNQAEHRGQIVGRVSITERPAISHQRGRRGDDESDLMLGQQGKAAVSVTVDRKSRYVHLALMSDRTATAKVDALIQSLRRAPVTVQTLTLDNGKENSQHEAIRRYTGLRCYFTSPYAAWEKGTVENVIGVLRKLLPKSSDFSLLTKAPVRKLEAWFNHRPMKVLGFKTPHEVYNAK